MEHLLDCRNLQLQTAKYHTNNSTDQMNGWFVKEIGEAPAACRPLGNILL